MTGLTGGELDPEAIMRNFESRIAGIREQAENAKSELEANTVTVTSKDRSTTVTVNGSGALLNLEFSARAEGMTPQQLAARVMETYGQAAAEAAQRTAQIMAGLIGQDNEAMDVLKAAMPPAPDDDEDDNAGKAW